MTNSKKPSTKKAPAKKKTAAKSTATRTKRTSGKKPDNGKRSWLKTLWSFGWKSSIALAAVLLFIGIYLDSVVKERFDGQLFELPTVVYARILNLSPGENISIKELRNELDVLSYRKVSTPRYPGNILRLLLALN